jgi:hypothetical protein
LVTVVGAEVVPELSVTAGAWGGLVLMINEPFVSIVTLPRLPAALVTVADGVPVKMGLPYWDVISQSCGEVVLVVVLQGDDAP